MTKGKRSVSKQGHLPPCCHSKDHKADNCKIFYLVSIVITYQIEYLFGFGLKHKVKNCSKHLQ